MHYFDGHQSEIQFRYAIGLLCHYSGNFEVARREFEIFLNESLGKEEYEVLRDSAIKYME